MNENIIIFINNILRFLYILQKFRIGKSIKKENFSKISENPGPGQYVYDIDPIKSSSRSVKFGLDVKYKSIRSNTPGPGNYDQKHYFGNEGKRITINGRYVNQNPHADLPGPGAYEPNVEIYKPSAKGFKMINPSKSGFDFRKDLPGPGHYKPNKESLSNFKHVPKWTMGNRTENSSLFNRIQKMHGDTPAPGNYDLNRSIGEGPKVIYEFSYDIFIVTF